MITFKKMKIQAPCTTANLGPGFDVFGLALDSMFDIVETEIVTDISGVEISISGVDADKIPTTPEQNTAGVVCLEFLKRMREEVGIRVHINKGVTPGTGLGSSAASAAATAFALNSLSGLNFVKNELVAITAQGELASAGVAHADNVTPSLLGGFTIIKSYDPIEVLNFPPPSDIEFAIAVPSIRYTTKEARAVLPKAVEIPRMVHNIGHAACVVVGMLKNDPELIGEGFSDIIIEKARSHLIEGYAHVRKSALDAGATGITLSGAGPTMIACVNPKTADVNEVVKAMKEAFEQHNVPCEAFTGRPTFGSKEI